MESLLTQIAKGLETDLYYLSLVAALCVPDICGALESEDGKTDRNKYMQWVEQYLIKLRPDKYGDRFSAEHVYQFRCALLHQGRTKHDNGEYKRILFFEPGTEVPIKGLHVCTVGSEDKSLVIDLRQFCTDIIAGARAWLLANEKKGNFIKNYEKFIKRYPNGISPVFGCSVVG